MSVINPRSHVPAYLQVAADIRARIASGDLAPGDAIPGETRLAQEFGLGRETIRKGLAVLRGEGLIVPRKGHGWFVRESGNRRPIDLEPGAEAYARMPTPDERIELDLDEGIPVMVIERPGEEPKLIPADEVRIVGRSGS